MDTARLIRWNIVVDAFGSAVFGAGLAFYLGRMVLIPDGAALFTIGLGTIVGLVLIIPFGAISDYVEEKRLLLWLQAAQLLSALCVMVFVSKELVYAGLCVLFLLSRGVSSVRGSIPTSYVEKRALIEFKAVVRTHTLIAAAVGAFVASTVAMVSHGAGLLVIPALNAVSFAAALCLTWLLPASEKRNHMKTPSLKGIFQIGSSGVIAVVAAFIVYTLNATMSNVSPFLVKGLGSKYAWILTASTVVGIVAALLFQKVLRADGPLGSWLRAQIKAINPAFSLSFIMAFVGMLVMCGVVLFDASSGWKSAGLIAIALLSEVSLVFGSSAVWEAQYSLGDDSRRGAMVGIFTFAGSLGMAAGPMIGAALLH